MPTSINQRDLRGTLEHGADRMNNAEIEFIREIDCRFPYDDLERCKDLIDHGIAISPNAAFMALHEICRPPRSVQNRTKQLISLLDYWRSHFDHPAADMLKEVAASMIRHQALSAEDVIARMETLATHSRLYIALGILLFACDDVEGRVEQVYEAICQRWEAIDAS